MSEKSGSGPTCALLWDLDNIAPGYRHLSSVAEALTDMAGPEAIRVAAARRATYRSVGDLLTASGIEVLSGGTRRNGADKVLIARARLLRRSGVDSFVVASNDGRFAQVATFASLHVVTLDVGQLNERLVSAAAAITQLTTSGGRWGIEPVLHRGGL